jgi:aldehyde:ferredoxin oxidoreductase
MHGEIQGVETVKLLSVDLSRSAVEYEPVEEGLVDSFVGGRGITTRWLFDHTTAHEEPLAEGAAILFGTGPVTGTPFPMGGRYVATARSPLTGTIFTGCCGGRLGIYLKKAGIDLLVVKGIAEAPAYLLIDDGVVKLLNGQDLWGRGKAEVKTRLRDLHGSDVSIALIGKAGENGVLFSNIENDGRYLGRGGLGAILGTKRLKAIVVRGRKKVSVPRQADFSFIAYECKKWLAANPVTSQGLGRFGTGILLNYMRELGLLSTRNHRAAAPLEAMNISGEMVSATLLERRRACPFCPVACGRVTKYGDGPEYESLWAMGSNLAIFDLEKVAELNALCNELGLDTISTGSVLGMAAELSESGKLSREVRYGDVEQMKEVMHYIAERRDIGEILSLGTKRMGEYFSAPELGAEIKGLDLPAYDPRGAYGQALGYATSNRGGCHLQGYLIGTEVLGIPKLLDRFGVAGKASLLAQYQNLSAFTDTMIMCRFAGFAVPGDYYARILNAVTERKVTWEDTLIIGERIWNLERLFNLREGVEEDRLPARFDAVPLKPMLQEYYEIRGWDERGVPKPETLQRLGL